MVEIITLGNFQIKINGVVVSDNFKRTTRLLQLLNLLIINRNKPLSVNTICESIWNADTDTATGKALHNLIYRLRTFFSEHNEPDCIAYNNKTYMLVNSADLTIDVHVLEDCYSGISNPTVTSEEKIGLLEKITGLHNGEYMSNLTCDDISSYSAGNRYRRIFTESVCMLSDIYIEKNEYDKMFSLCEKAILLEPLEELIYHRIIKGMRDKGRDVQALNLVENYFEILYREAGIRASDTMNVLYKELKSKTNTSKSDVVKIADELKEASSLDKAMFCSFDVFKDIFRYELRQISRRKYNIALILVDINGGKDEVLPYKMLYKAQRSFHECCMQILRKGDVFAGYSKSQSVLMLTIMNETDVDIIIPRLRNRFYSLIMGDKVYLDFDNQICIPPE